MKSVSIIIVAFHAKEKLKKCLASIPKNKKIEVLVIDNSSNNRGFGKACNVGAQKAKNEILFFLNPDTILFANTIQLLVEKLENNSEIGIISPQFLDDNNISYISYSSQPTMMSSPFRFSFLQQLLPKFLQQKINPVQFDSANDEKFVEGVSGAGLMLSQKIFDEVGGFDEQFFMYWEDFDICKKVLRTGKKILFYPTAKMIHTLAGTTNDSQQAQKYFNESRYLFFKKHFGIVYGFFMESFLRTTEKLSLR